MEKATIYILINPLFENVVKIGYTKNLKRRVNELNSQTGLPSPYYCYAAYYCGNGITDIQIHKAIDAVDASLRFDSNKEFYKMSPQKAYDIFVAIAKLNNSMKNVVFNPLNDSFIHQYATNHNIVYEDNDKWQEKCCVIGETVVGKDNNASPQKKYLCAPFQQTMKALADPTRREIVHMLKNGRLSAGEIVEKFKMTGAAVSKHLSILKEADLVRDERNGKFIYYELNTSVLEDVLCWVAEIKGDEKL